MEHIRKMIGEKIGGYWYYFDESGWMVTGWKKVNGDWYYFNQYGEGSEGQMRTGTMYKNGKNMCSIKEAHYI